MANSLVIGDFRGDEGACFYWLMPAQWYTLLYMLMVVYGAIGIGICLSRDGYLDQ